MGTTLENGVYLPSEGERNCYAGLKTNWEILDQKVADVTALQQAVAGALHREIVESLPTTDIDPNTIYMILSGTSATENVYNEYMYVNNAWELIGTSATDLTNYYTKAEVDGKLLLKANDSDVVHTSGNETISGDKTFSNNKVIVGRNTDIVSVVQFVNADVVGDSANGTSGFEVYGSSVSDANKIGGVTVGEYSNNGGSYALIECNRTVSGVKSSNVIRSIIRTDGSKELSAIVDNDCKLGNPFLRWSKIYGTEYYYGANNVEFSTKFVTTDTNQTISGNKTFSSNVNVYNSDSTTDTANIVLKNSKAERGSTTNIDEQNISFVDKNNNQLGNIKCINNSSGVTNMYITCNASGNDVGVRLSRAPNVTYFRATTNNDCKLGTTDIRWSDVQTYKVNNLEPSSLSLPSGNASDIIDISSYLVNLDGTLNTYTAPANGWISITMNNCSGMQAYITGFWGHQIVRPTTGGIRFLMPILKNQTTNILIFNGTIDNARFIPCQGNV